MSHAVWYAVEHRANQHIILPTEVWAGPKQDGRDMNGCQCADCTMTTSMEGTECPAADEMLQKEPPEPRKETMNELPICLICGDSIEGEFIPLLIIEGAKATVGMECSIHRECFYVYDERIHGEISLDVVVIE